ncbi:uncharacterized protein LOC134542680 isoform X2 [Bacillus rossius redtenbacheri]|uniref:uncharacterized protein LOC134542680 isoform X2 n=1 Tax=Bacillus rossius redtenbacheri TaxID=93214 RepID=UPI002FDC93F1
MNICILRKKARRGPLKWRPERTIVMVCRSRRQSARVAAACCPRAGLEDRRGAAPAERVPSRGNNNVWPKHPLEKTVSTENRAKEPVELLAEAHVKSSDHVGQQTSSPGTEPFNNTNSTWLSDSPTAGDTFPDLGLGVAEESFVGTTDFTPQATARANKSPEDQDFIDLTLGAQEECYAMTPEAEASQLQDICDILRESNCSITEEVSATVGDSQSKTKHLERRYLTPDKTAQRLFRKRMLVLYHWLHPGVSNSKLNSILAKTWESLPSDEKEYYLLQLNSIAGPNESTEDRAAVDALLESLGETARDAQRETPGAREHSSPSPPQRKKRTGRGKRDSASLAGAGAAPCNEDALWDLNLADTHARRESDVFWNDVPTIRELFHMSE